MSIRIIPLIMCGGAGTRLWPLSREQHPKQFVKLFGDSSTFQETLRRVSDPQVFERPIIITAASYREFVLQQLAEIGAVADILLESARRDSGPAIAAGTVFARQHYDTPIVLALAADHIIRDPSLFVSACADAQALAVKGRIVTFGINPDRAATEYGYISPGEIIAGSIRSVREFVEKPDALTAERYVKAGYLWNSGNFMFHADTLLAEYRAADAPSLAAVTHAVERSVKASGCISLDKLAFESASPISIDYAVMEHTKQAAVISVSMGWSDVGSWRAVWELSDKDEFGNSLNGPAVVEGASNCYVSTEKTLVALEGVDNLTVVSTADAVLISRQADANGLKRLVGKLNNAAPVAASDHPTGSRVAEEHQLFDVPHSCSISRFVIKPNDGWIREPELAQGGLKHWIIVSGVAHVLIGDDWKMVEKGQSILVSPPVRHGVRNVGVDTLELIEVQILI